jgi:thioredoxin 1
MRNAIALVLAGAASLVMASTPIYNEAADAKAEIHAALVDAQRSNLPVLVVFGANWCGDCKVLDTAFNSGTSAALIAKNYRVVHVNVGRFDRNVELAESYGVPLRKGIPAVVVLSRQGKVIYATRAGELADAQSMGEDGIYAFFSKVAPAGSR